MDNGDVEVFACGSNEALDLLCAWLHEGPPLASVAAVEQNEAEHQELAGFTTG